MRSTYVCLVLMKYGFGDGCLRVRNKGQFIRKGLIFCRENALVGRMMLMPVFQCLFT